jgi:hypothetical protein
MPLQTITSPHQILGGLKQWQQQLNPPVSLPVEPRAPWNLRILGAATANSLSWEKVPGATGYEVQVSQNGDFSQSPIIATSSDPTATAHIDNTIGAGVKRWYRVRSVAGATNQPNVVKSPWTAPVISTSNSGTTTYDQDAPCWISRLTERVPQVVEKIGEPGRTRTCNPLIKSQLLYH